MTRKTTNIYKAAYFLVHGVDLKEITERRSKGGRRVWTYIFESVPFRVDNLWNVGTAEVNVRDFQAARERLKKISKTDEYNL